MIFPESDSFQNDARPGYRADEANGQRLSGIITGSAGRTFLQSGDAFTKLARYSERMCKFPAKSLPADGINRQSRNSIPAKGKNFYSSKNNTAEALLQ